MRLLDCVPALAHYILFCSYRYSHLTRVRISDCVFVRGLINYPLIPGSFRGSLVCLFVCLFVCLAVQFAQAGSMLCSVSTSRQSHPYDRLLVSWRLNDAASER
jgi:hypothetical protein